MQRDGYSSEFWTLLQHDEAEIPNNEILSDFCAYHMSFQPLEIPSTSHHGSQCTENSKVDLYVEDEFYVVDSCHKKNGHICQLLEEYKLVEDILGETHNFIGSINQDTNNLMESMKNFVDINGLLEKCCWKASGGEMEGQSFLDE